MQRGWGDSAARHRDQSCEKPQPLLSSQVRQHQRRPGLWKRMCRFFFCSQRAQGWFNFCTAGQAGFCIAVCLRPTGIQDLRAAHMGFVRARHGNNSRQNRLCLPTFNGQHTQEPACKPAESWLAASASPGLGTAESREPGIAFAQPASSHLLVAFPTLAGQDQALLLLFTPMQAAQFATPGMGVLPPSWLLSGSPWWQGQTHTPYPGPRDKDSGSPFGCRHSETPPRSLGNAAVWELALGE